MPGTGSNSPRSPRKAPAVWLLTDCHQHSDVSRREDTEDRGTLQAWSRAGILTKKQELLGTQETGGLTGKEERRGPGRAEG